MTQNSPIDFIENFIHSFEDQIQKIESVFRSSEAVSDSSHMLFHDFQHSLIELREERTQLNAILRETLARNGSLRKNDYNSIMDGIFALLDEKEQDAERSFSSYIEDQKTLVSFLKHGILAVKTSSLDDNKKYIEEFKKELEHIIVTQQQRKNLVISKFLEFQNIHNKIIESFKMILEKDDSTCCKDIKKIKKYILEEIV